MKSKWIVGLMFAVLILGVSVLSPVVNAADSEFVVADFNLGDKPNNVGGDFGAWDKDPSDESQSAEFSFDADDALGAFLGYSIRLNYDVDSENAAYNGFWMKLNDFDASTYNTLNFYIRGSSELGFTKRLKVELKDTSERPSAYIIAGITEDWQKVSIPLSKFRRIKDWESLREFVIVFDDMNSRPKTGSIYIDHVTFSKE